MAHQQGQPLRERDAGSLERLEIERAYFVFDEPAVRAALSKIATHAGEHLFKVVAFEPASADMTTMRVRDEGARTTMTIKRATLESRYLIEDEVTVSDFDATVRMLELLGMKKRYYVEKLRDIWRVGSVEVVFDTYPGLPAFIEIEGPSEESVASLAEHLGLHEDPLMGAMHMYLQHYGITTDRPRDDLSFATAADVLGKYVTRDRAQFSAMLEAQKARAGD